MPVYKENFSLFKNNDLFPSESFSIIKNFINKPPFPRTMNRMEEYQENAQRYSQKHGELFRELRKNRCEICKSNNSLVIHHKQYTKDFKHWMLLCHKCHWKIHRVKGFEDKLKLRDLPLLNLNFTYKAKQ